MRALRAARVGLVVAGIVCVLFAGVTASLHADAVQPITFETVATGVPNVVDIQAPPDGSGRLFFVQQTGQIRVWRSSGLQVTPFLDLSALVSCCSERGLLGLVFHPSYGGNGYF